MSEVETLLAVDAGRVPPGTAAIFARDPEAPGRRLGAVQTGMIVRGVHGLATFSFDEIADIHALNHEPHVGLLVIRRDGKRFFVDTGSFERGGEVSVLVGRRLASRTA